MDFLEECIAGNRISQEGLYNHFSPKMFAICLRYARDYHMAEDLLQEGFIKVFKNLHRYRKEGSFEGWLRRIFINTAIENYRRDVRTKYHLQPLESANNASLENEAPGRLAAQDLLAIIQQLPDGYRLIFNLYAIEGYSHKEIAKLMNITVGTSKSQLSRARKHLKVKIMKLRQNEKAHI